jgi:hypothetical protein
MNVRTYRVTVDGELSEALTSTFGSMRSESVDGKTILTGPIRDQAELHGLLTHIASLGLTLLEVTTPDETPTAQSR